MATMSAAAMPGLAAGAATLHDMDGDTEDKFLADFAREFMQHSASLELPASLNEFGSFPSPGIDLPQPVGRSPTLAPETRCPRNHHALALLARAVGCTGS